MYELYEVYCNSSTNHSGPYKEYNEAYDSTFRRIKGCSTLQTVHIIPRSAPQIHPKYSICAITRKIVQNETMLLEAQEWIDKKKAEGWTREDFVKQLGSILGMDVLAQPPGFGHQYGRHHE